MSLQLASVQDLFYPGPEEITSRAGVIPYSYLYLDVDPDDAGVEDGEEYWLMGTLPSGRLSDFGGQCISVDRETPYECLLREVDEESNGLLTELIREQLDSAFEQYVDHGEVPDYVHVWRWVNRRRQEDLSYLVFVELDYDQVVEAISNFEGNQENIAINWWPKQELIRRHVDDFNTSIQKFIRRFE